MRLVRQHEFGGPEVLCVEEVERPRPWIGEVLVRVRAAGVNPVDWKTRAGHGVPGALTLPMTVGWDISGVVEEVGPGVSLFQPGDEVFGMPAFPRQAAAYADYAVAATRQLARKPAGVDHVTAAGLPLAGLTAWQFLVDTAKVAAGQRVLVHAAAGGVGHLAVQIAKLRGAHVIGTARAEKHEFLRGLGVDEVIDYTAVDFTRAVSDVDVVIDLVGGETGLRSVEVLRSGGLLLTAPTHEPEMQAAAEARGVRYGVVIVEPDHAALAELAALVDSGRLRVEVDSVFPLAEVGKAHERGETGRAQGKIVLTT
ncbi:NADP-dependent oxidoreductase [Streptoalloteichus hindustanus]|nr:NADP-dependent oxidoreductase [Streptoalloteichus hindustanus]